MKEVDAYKKMSWRKIISKVTFVLKVNMNMFIWMNLCRAANHEKGSLMNHSLIVDMTQHESDE